jgi:polar amino acid transport system substrate-binding protein
MVATPNLTRRGFLTGAGAVGGLIVAPGLLAACSKTDSPRAGGDKEPGKKGEAGLLAKLKKQGFVRVGFAGEAPYGFKDGDKLAGEAPTLHKEIFTALGIKELRPSVVDFGALIPSLLANKFDVVSAGMAITPERCAKVLFSEPEFVGPTALMVKKGNPKKLTDLKSAAKAKVKVGVLKGAVEESYAVKAGVAKGSISVLPKQQDGLDALAAGRIDAFALTGFSLRWLQKSGSNKSKPVEVLEDFIPVIDGKKQYSPGGAVFRMADAELRDAFNAELKKITGDKTKYVDLIGKYGFTEAAVPPADLKTADLCKA